MPAVGERWAKGGKLGRKAGVLPRRSGDGSGSGGKPLAGHGVLRGLRGLAGLPRRAVLVASRCQAPASAVVVGEEPSLSGGPPAAQRSLPAGRWGSSGEVRPRAVPTAWCDLKNLGGCSGMKGSSWGKACEGMCAWCAFLTLVVLPSVKTQFSLEKTIL